MDKVINYLIALDEKRYEDAQNITADINDLDIYLCLSGMSDEVLKAMPNWQWFELIKLAKDWKIISYILHRALSNPAWEELLRAALYQAIEIRDYDFASKLLSVMPLNSDRMKIKREMVISVNLPPYYFGRWNIQRR